MKMTPKNNTQEYKKLSNEELYKLVLDGANQIEKSRQAKSDHILVSGEFAELMYERFQEIDAEEKRKNRNVNIDKIIEDGEDRGHSDE